MVKRRELDPEDKPSRRLEMKLSDILDSGGNEYGRLLIVDKKQGRNQHVKPIRRGVTLRSVSENLIRVQEEADPLQFLVDAQKGALFPVIYVDEENDTIKVRYQQYNLKDRLAIAKFLANKIVPTVSLSKVIVGEDEARNIDPARADYAAMVELAAAMSNNAPSHKIRDAVEVEDSEDNN